MTTPLTKLIAENKERPIAGAVRGQVYILKGVDAYGTAGYTVSKMRHDCNGYYTHFRPLPDDRLAFVAEHYRAGVDAFISMFEPLAEKSGIYGAALEFAQGLQKQAEAIAEGKNEAHNG